MALALALVALTAARTGAADEPAIDDEEEVIDVTVTGDPTAPSPRDPTPASYAIRRERLSEPGLDLADALDRAPGVTIARTGGRADPAFVSLRGGRSAQTPVYLSSLPLNDDITGQFDLSSLPPWMLHHATVYRGHAPRWVDELGMGGAVILEPLLPRGTHASAAVGAGSFGAREGRAALSVGDETAAALVAVGHRAGAGDFPYLDDNGTRFEPSDDVERRRHNADHREADGWAIARARLGRARLTAFAHAFSRDAGAPGLLLPGARHSRVAVRRIAGGASAAIDCAGPCRVELDAGYLSTRYHLSDPLGEIGQRRDVDNRGSRLTERLRIALRPARGWALGLGVSHRRSTLALDTEHAVRERARRHVARPVIDTLWTPLPGLDLVAVAALSCQTTQGGGDSGRLCEVLEPTGRAGIRYAPLPWLEAFGNVGRYLRAPTLGETYGVSVAVLGNPDLAVETGLSAELGLRGRGDGDFASVHGEIVAFSRFADDLVGYRRASLGAVRPYNVGSARVVGAEIFLGARFVRHLGVEVALTFLDARDTSDDRQVDNDLLPYVARIAVAPALVLRSPRWDAIGLEEASLALRHRHQGERFADPAGLSTLPAQNLLELSAALSFDPWTLRLRAENLLDDRTFDLVGYPLPGRSVHGLVEVAW